jgi:preprotein translocase subunit SecD
MKFWLGVINIYLLVVVILVSGCKTEDGKNGAKKKKPKDETVLFVNVETTTDNLDRSLQVPVYRAEPTLIMIERSPLLDERDLTGASVVEGMGGFVIRLQFDASATRRLEMATTARKGQRLAIFSQFGQDKRWLAAPVIHQRILDGVLVFTPDATREEANKIVKGLNKLADEKKKREKSGF